MTAMTTPPKKTYEPRPGPQGHSETKRMTAQALYESDPNITTTEIARQVGCAPRTLQDWAKDGKWKRCMQPMSNRAHMIADQFKTELEAIGPDPTPEQKEVIANAIIEKDATGQRADVLSRHRKEWNNLRGLLQRAIVQAVEAKGFEAAKFSKIIAENLTLIQNGERKAWGMDKGGDDDNVVVIDRRNG